MYLSILGLTTIAQHPNEKQSLPTVLKDLNITSLLMIFRGFLNLDLSFIYIRLHHHTNTNASFTTAV